MIATYDLGSQSNGYTHVPMGAIRIYNPNVVVSIFFSIIPKLLPWVQHKSSAMRMSSSGLPMKTFVQKRGQRFASQLASLNKNPDPEAKISCRQADKRYANAHKPNAPSQAFDNHILTSDLNALQPGSYLLCPELTPVILNGRKQRIS